MSTKAPTKTAPTTPDAIPVTTVATSGAVPSISLTDGIWICASPKRSSGRASTTLERSTVKLRI